MSHILAAQSLNPFVSHAAVHSIPPYFAGDLDATNLAAAKLARMESALRGAVHTSDHMQRSLRTCYQSRSASYIDAQYLPGFDYDETFGEGG